MAKFWDSLNAVQIRNESGLKYAQINEDSLETMTAYVERRIESNGVRVRKTIDSAAGRFNFTQEGFSDVDLAGLFPGKVEGDKHLAEGVDISTLAAQAVRLRVLFDLESRNKGDGSNPYGGGTGQAKSYLLEAKDIEAGIVKSIQDALEGPDRSDDGQTGSSREAYSSSAESEITWF